MRRLSSEALDWLYENIPDAPVSPKGGRPAANKRKVLEGIFWVLNNGAHIFEGMISADGKTRVHLILRKDDVGDGAYSHLLS